MTLTQSYQSAWSRWKRYTYTDTKQTIWISLCQCTTSTILIQIHAMSVLIGNIKVVRLPLVWCHPQWIVRCPSAGVVVVVAVAVVLDC